VAAQISMFPALILFGVALGCTVLVFHLETLKEHKRKSCRKQWRRRLRSEFFCCWPRAFRALETAAVLGPAARRAAGNKLSPRSARKLDVGVGTLRFGDGYDDGAATWGGDAEVSAAFADPPRIDATPSPAPLAPIPLISPRSSYAAMPWPISPGTVRMPAHQLPSPRGHALLVPQMPTRVGVVGSGAASAFSAARSRRRS
jgi:hypothetical protein|tara:strand:+ start:195 stop:797 length:603 start_codon:yes stop_codon:yes gene_type:complete